MLKVFTYDLRVENGILAMFGLTATVMIAQLGGIPTPKIGSKLSLANWSLWMLAVCVQWFSTFLSLVMAGESYMLFAEESRDCMVPFTEDSELARLNVVAGLTFFVQPIFLNKLLVMYFFALVFVEGVKVFARTRAWEWAMGGNVPTYWCCFRALQDSTIDSAIMFNYMTLFV